MGQSHAKNLDAWKVSVPPLYDVKPGDGCERTAQTIIKMAKIDQSNGQNNKILSMDDTDKNLGSLFCLLECTNNKPQQSDLLLELECWECCFLVTEMHLTTKLAEIDPAQGTEPAVPNR